MGISIVMFYPLQLPQVECPMYRTVVIDKSILKVIPDIKINSHEDGSILLSTSNYTEVASNPSHANSTSESNLVTSLFFSK